MIPTRTLWKLSFWVAGSVVASIVLVGIVLFIRDHGILFVEGDRAVLTGSAYGFRIGSSRAEAFATLRDQYSSSGDHVFVVWRRAAVESEQLVTFGNPGPRDIYANYRMPVHDLAEIPKPLQVVDRWHIEMPGRWINEILLTFKRDRLSEIRRSRWVFQRSGCVANS